MSDIEILKLEMRKKKAEAAIAELLFKIAEREQDIQRIRDHILLQEEQLKEVNLKLEQVKGES